MNGDSSPTVVFVGQPNCGKSTLFNSIAGLKAETSNFPGTTVKHTHSRVNIDGAVLNIIDLPGTYSLCPQDPAERVALRHLFSEKPDVVVNVVDASTLSRGLELTLELIELGYPTVVALNMVDLAERRGVKVDAAGLEAALGVPVVPTVALYGRGVKELLDRVFALCETRTVPPEQAFSEDIERLIREVEQVLPGDFPLISGRRFAAVKLIETGGFYCGELLQEAEPGLKRVLDRVEKEISADRGVPAYEAISAERHHLAMKLFEASSCVLRGRRVTWETRLDAFLMHPWLGYPIMALVFLGFFMLVFKVGSPLESALLGPLARLRLMLAGWLGAGFAGSLVDGLMQGVGGGLAIVIPYLLPLLFLMSLLEDVGYTARAGFLLDAFMHRIGLHGKSAAPFILGFGCNVPALMATRILESRRDRIITSLLVPFIPCSARTTIILALVAFYLGPFYALGFYVLNIVVVALLGYALGRFFKEPSPGLILEIPSLKWPSASSILKKVWVQVRSFLRFAWPLLMAGSVVLSLLAFLGAVPAINAVLAPLVVNGLGLPRELGMTLVFGFLRRELSLLMMLQALGVEYRDLLTVITKEQILVFTVFINFFIPCFSTFATLWKEVGRKWALLSLAISFALAASLGFAVRLVF